MGALSTVPAQGTNRNPLLELTSSRCASWSCWKAPREGEVHPASGHPFHCVWPSILQTEDFSDGSLFSGNTR